MQAVGVSVHRGVAITEEISPYSSNGSSGFRRSSLVGHQGDALPARPRASDIAVSQRPSQRMMRLRKVEQHSTVNTDVAKPQVSTYLVCSLPCSPGSRGSGENGMQEP